MCSPKREDSHRISSIKLTKSFFPSGCIIEEQIAYFGSYIGFAKVENQEACARLSLVTHGSHFWSYVPADRLCVLKSSDSGRTPHAGAVSGNSECGRNQTKV